MSLSLLRYFGNLFL
ncbi:hypothetical protein CP061683_0313A, partial [Chlamydia psittaci 06-1683]